MPSGTDDGLASMALGLVACAVDFVVVPVVVVVVSLTEELDVAASAVSSPETTAKRFCVCPCLAQPTCRWEIDCAFPSRDAAPKPPQRDGDWTLEAEHPRTKLDASAPGPPATRISVIDAVAMRGNVRGKWEEGPRIGRAPRCGDIVEVVANKPIQSSAVSRTGRSCLSPQL